MLMNEPTYFKKNEDIKSTKKTRNIYVTNEVNIRNSSRSISSYRSSRNSLQHSKPSNQLISDILWITNSVSHSILKE